ncbi:sulfotransferase family 2 domain-containing protein [Catenovulum sp. SM1970]|uniref:sulfotransferase family 2 domain-containing protein n=1 Tax=Marinifaba aquimaris TaxID=2741323 RepID=UPI0015749006|nr:sulfotransferase family 2 domain-containing protein [Marinifaba aquimaris]NTS75356.1 sulfotransferase family 2 domain-containing protein [Marinifaba aquimaris]
MSNNLGVFGKKVVFIHIPKNAGTSVKSLLNSVKDNIHFDVISTSNELSFDDWLASFKFCIVRNPYDRAVSSYCYHVKSDYKGDLYKRYPNLKSMSFYDYLMLRKNNREFLLMPQVNFITRRDSDVGVNEILRLEQLQGDIKKLSKILGVELDLHHLNASPRTKDYKTFYTQETFDLVSEIYQEDLSRFNYSF